MDGKATVENRAEELWLRACVCTGLAIPQGLESSSKRYAEILQDERHRRPTEDAERGLSLLSKACFLAPDNARYMESRGDILLRMGDLRGAVMHFRRASALDKNDTCLRHKLAKYVDTVGCLFFEDGLLFKALAFFDEAIELHCREPGFFLHRAFVHLENKAYSKMLQDLSQYLDLDNTNAEVFLLRGKLYWKLGMTDKATRDITRAGQLMPNHEEFTRFQSLLLAEASSENASASRQMLLGDFQGALETLQRALKVNREDVGMNLLAATACRQLGILDKAEEYLSRAMGENTRLRNEAKVATPFTLREFDEIKQEKAFLLEQRALNLMSAVRDYQGAIHRLNEAIHLHPSCASLYVTRGDCFRETGQLKASMLDYEKALLHLESSEIASVQSRIAILFYLHGQQAYNNGKYLEAEVQFSQAIEKNPRVAEYYANRGLARTSLRKAKEAYQDFGLALKLDPSNARAKSWLATHRMSLHHTNRSTPDERGAGVKTSLCATKKPPRRNVSTSSKLLPIRVASLPSLPALSRAMYD